jgi:hypothetical protein
VLVDRVRWEQTQLPLQFLVGLDLAAAVVVGHLQDQMQPHTLVLKVH